MRTGKAVGFLGDQIIGLTFVERNRVGGTTYPSVKRITVRGDVNLRIVFGTEDGSQADCVVKIFFHLRPVVLRVVFATKGSHRQDVTCVHRVQGTQDYINGYILCGRDMQTIHIRLRCQGIDVIGIAHIRRIPLGRVHMHIDQAGLRIFLFGF